MQVYVYDRKSKKKERKFYRITNTIHKKIATCVFRLMKTNQVVLARVEWNPIDRVIRDEDKSLKLWDRNVRDASRPVVEPRNKDCVWPHTDNMESGKRQSDWRIRGRRRKRGNKSDTWKCTREKNERGKYGLKKEKFKKSERVGTRKRIEGRNSMRWTERKSNRVVHNLDRYLQCEQKWTCATVCKYTSKTRNKNPSDYNKASGEINDKKKTSRIVWLSG